MSPRHLGYVVQPQGLIRTKVKQNNLIINLTVELALSMSGSAILAVTDNFGNHCLSRDYYFKKGQTGGGSRLLSRS